MSNDNRKVAVVTGASRGAGAGIARALGEAGYAVYVTGRTTKEGTAALPGTIGATAAAIDGLGGRGVAVAVDHRKDDEVKALFDSRITAKVVDLQSGTFSDAQDPLGYDPLKAAKDPALALTKFRELLAHFPGDSVGEFYVKRCTEELSATPAASDKSAD